MRLRPGENCLSLRPSAAAAAATSQSPSDYVYSLSVFFRPTPSVGRPVVKLVYITYEDGDGKFQAPSRVANDAKSAAKRISLAAQLVQCFMG